MARPFLTAEWRNVVLANYRVPPELLEPYVPPGVSLDTPDAAGELQLVSLVAFTFARTRVHGIPVPGGEAFGEVNVRFYTRCGLMRAATFVREFVPAPLVAFGARALYRQPYALARIDHRMERDDESVRTVTTFRRGAIAGEIRVVADAEPVVPPAGSEEHFLKEHYWGFDRGWSGATYRYRVDHPVWRTWPVREARIGLDPGMLLGGEWASLDWGSRLRSVLLAEGSRAVVWSAESMPTECAAIRGSAW